MRGWLDTVSSFLLFDRLTADVWWAVGSGKGGGLLLQSSMV
jgi:hypothetical protein